jgi:hypothetical protein
MRAMAKALTGFLVILLAGCSFQATLHKLV